MTAAIDAVVAYLFAEQRHRTCRRCEPPPRAAPNAERTPSTRSDVSAVMSSATVRATSEPPPNLRPAARRNRQQDHVVRGCSTGSANPSRYSPGTRMPNLRLDAPRRQPTSPTYLTTLTDNVPAPPAIAPTRSAYRPCYDAMPRTRRRSVKARRVDRRRASRARRTRGDRALGCFNCHEIRGFERRSTPVRMRERPDGIEAVVAARSFDGPGTAARRASDGPPQFDSLRTEGAGASRARAHGGLRPDARNARAHARPGT